MTMNQALRAAARDLTANVRLTLANGAAVQAEAVSFSVDEGADSPLLPGAVLSAKYTLVLANDEGQWRWGGSLRGERPLIGATAQLFVNAGGQDIPCGAFIVDSVSADEGSGVVRLSGSDSIAHELSAEFADNLVYPATLGQLWACWLSQTPYIFDGSFPGGDLVIPAAPEWKKATLRRAAGWIVQAAGCFLRIGRTGALELVSCRGGEEIVLTPDDYMTLSDGFETFGPVHELTVTPADDDDAPLTVSDGLGAAVSVSGNPLFTAGDLLAGMAEALLEKLSGLVLTKADFRWRGDPAAGVGDVIVLTDTSGAVLRCTVTRQTLKFDRGFSANVSCGIPESGSGGVVRAVTPEGGLNAAALVGAVDGGLLRAQSVTAKAIAAQSVSAGHLSANAVTAEKIAAGAVGAEKLAAGAVTAEKLHADSVSGQTARFMAAEMRKIRADDVQTHELYAAFAHLVELAAGSIAAGDVRADRLAAQLAKVVSLQAAVGEFDFAAVQNLVANALSLEQGAAESVYIRNLAVTSANLLSATLGNLVIRGNDGRYYRVFIGSGGSIGAEAVAVTDGEISAGATAAGQQILETDLNVANLNASNLQASSAVINRILTAALTAGKITAAEAMIASATIPALYTTAVRAIGESLILTVGDRNRVFRSEVPPADAGPGDLWIQPSAGYIYQTADGGDLPEFCLNEQGDLYYTGSFDLMLDAAGDLYLADDAPLAAALSQDGTPVWWQRVKDADLKAVELRLTDEAIVGTVRKSSAYQDDLSARDSGISRALSTANAAGTAAGNAQSAANSAAEAAGKAQTSANAAQDTANAAQTSANAAQYTANAAQTSANAAQDTANAAQTGAANAQSAANKAQAAADRTHADLDTAQTNLEQQIYEVCSEVEQTAERFEVRLGEKIGRDELRTYMRYEDGVLELGRSGSRYTTQTSDRGFVVLQDGSPMASMEQNTISAPVINAQRMFTIGEHSIRMGASGHLIFN